MEVRLLLSLVYDLLTDSFKWLAELPFIFEDLPPLFEELLPDLLCAFVFDDF